MGNAFVGNVHGFSLELINNRRVQMGTAGNANGYPEYIGYAAPGTPATTEAWLICKIEYDAAGNDISRTWADGVHEFNKAFVTPENYNYS